MDNNPGLPSALKRRTGVEAVTVIDLHITDLLPPEPKPTAQVTSEYRLTVQDIENLTKRAVTMLREYTRGNTAGRKTAYETQQLR